MEFLSAFLPLFPCFYYLRKEHPQGIWQIHTWSLPWLSLLSDRNILTHYGLSDRLHLWFSWCLSVLLLFYKIKLEGSDKVDFSQALLVITYFFGRCLQIEDLLLDLCTDQSNLTDLLLPKIYKKKLHLS